MADTLLGLNRDSLGEEGQKIYDSISGSVFPRVCVSLYSTAQYEVQSGNYDDAISDLEKIQKMDDSYSEGGVYKLLGDAYAGKGDKDNAKSNYEKQRPIIREHRQHIRHRAHWMQWDQMELRRILPVEQAPRDNKI